MSESVNNILNQIDDTILTGGNRTTAAQMRALMKNIARGYVIIFQDLFSLFLSFFLTCII